MKNSSLIAEDTNLQDKAEKVIYNVRAYEFEEEITQLSN